MSHVLALNPGTELVGDFRIERVLGVGGFGITYLAQEIALARAVTIKEYFPTDFAARGPDQSAVPRSSDCSGDYKWGLDRFIEEAQTLARFDHRNICRVYRYFRTNNTGYMVLHFEEGASLKGWLTGLKRAPRQAEIDKLVSPLLEALDVIHKADFLHRDIAPDNIMVRKDGSPVLVDFGSARGEIARHSRTVSALVKPGYSPYEQYAEKGAQQGPWTDIYAFAATLYHMITGKRPPDSPSRIVKDEYVPAKEAALASYRTRFLAAIDRGLDLDIKRRPQSVAEWRGELLAPDAKPAKKGWLAGGEAEPPPNRKRAKTVAVAPAAEAAPPPPDAPGPKGGILDFFEGLKKQATPVAAADELAAPPPPPSVKAPEPAATPAAKPAAARAKAKPVTRAMPIPPPPAPAPPAVQPRPRAMRSGSRWGRRAAVILLVGAGIASASFGLRDRLPTTEMRRTGITTSSTSKSVSEAAPALEIKAHAAAVVGLGFSGDQLVTVGADGAVKVWGSGGWLGRTVAVPGTAATSMAVLARRAVIGHADGSAVLWDIERGDRIASFKRNEANVWAVSFAGSADRVAVASHDWSIAVWDAARPALPVETLEGHDSAAQAVAFSAAKGLIASGAADRTVKLWNVDGGSLVRSYRGHRDFVTAVDFSADGRLVAAAALDGVIRVWSTSSNRLVATLSGHRGKVSALSFAPTGDQMASVGDDGVLRIWEARRGRLHRAFAADGAGGALRSVTFSANGKRLAVGAESGIVRVRDAEPVATAARAGRD